MKIDGKSYRTIWLANERTVRIIDQRRLPHRFVLEELRSSAEVAAAIAGMHLRGAPLIGAAAAWGIYLAAREARRSGSFDEYIKRAATRLIATRPTASDLARAVERQLATLAAGETAERKVALAREGAERLADESAAQCRRIGEHGLPLIAAISRRKRGAAVNLLTHCNAGWLACVDYGTATAPIYAAHARGLALHVWVAETRPRLQGALTAWELAQEGVPHHVIADNAGGHLMQRGLVDLVLVGTDRTTRTGDVANKIGTYLKALAARDNGIPFYVALPSSTLDPALGDGLAEIPIEERSPEEVRRVRGRDAAGNLTEVQLTTSPAFNPAFDVTPARLVTGLITDRGVCDASAEGIRGLYPEHG